jgi:hypothetical protein
MTNPIYEVIEAEGFTPERIKRTDLDGKVWWIPTDLSNSFYQEYLSSLKTTKTTKPAKQEEE